MKKIKKFPLQRILLFGLLCGIFLTGCKDGSVAFLEAELEKEAAMESSMGNSGTQEMAEKNAAGEITEKTSERNTAEETAGENVIEEASGAVEIVEASVIESESKCVYVHVCGAVINPGVYEVEEGSRIFQALEAAGGIRADAAAEYVNQAMTVTDGQQIYIPTQQEAQELTGAENGIFGAGATGSLTDSTSQETTEEDGKVNINTADAAALMTINGIGEARAQDIIAYREANGGFSTIEEIMNVAGIKEATFEKIKDAIKVK